MSREITITAEKRGNHVFPEPDWYRASCSCGWVAPIRHEHGHEARDFADRKHPACEPHDLEIRESGIFCQAACTCGWTSDRWHRRGLDMTRRWLQSEHATHLFEIKQVAS